MMSFDSFSDDDMNEFRDIYERQFKEDIGEDDARVMVINVPELYAALTKPLASKVASINPPEIDKTRNIDDDRVQFRSPPLAKVIDILPKKKPEI